MSPKATRKWAKGLKDTCGYRYCWMCSAEKVYKFKHCKRAPIIEEPCSVVEDDESDDTWCDCDSCLLPYVRTESGLIVVP